VGIASFDYATWSVRYAALAVVVAEPLATLYFGEAGLYLDNTDGSYVCDLVERATLLNMLTAHIAAVNGATAAGQAGIVGRISSVTEGSVTIASEYQVPPGSAAWYAQTPYGAQYWAATAKYRTMQYAPGPRPYLGVPGSQWSR
jgi:hypothetical protein